MKNLLLASTATAVAAAFANTKPRVEPVVTAISKAVAMPVKSSKRGSTSLYPFDQLTEVGMSFGVKNKTAANLSSIVSNANKRALKQATDPTTGKPVFKLDAAGAATTEPVMVASAHYFAADVADAKKDPDGATVRVFRDK